jgi:hypothetical protein
VARFDIVPGDSLVWIEADSSLHTITTRTDGPEGHLDLELDPDGGVDLGRPVSGHLSLAVERLRSGNLLEEREMRRRIQARRHPHIDGALVELGPSGSDGRYRARGRLTFRGVTNDHTDELAITRVDDRTLTVVGESTFDIRHYGMDPPQILLLRVRPEVRVRIELVLSRGD